MELYHTVAFRGTLKASGRSRLYNAKFSINMGAVGYPASRDMFSAWFLAFVKSFTSLTFE